MRKIINSNGFTYIKKSTMLHLMERIEAVVCQRTCITGRRLAQVISNNYFLPILHERLKVGLYLKTWILLRWDQNSTYWDKCNASHAPFNTSLKMSDPGKDRTIHSVHRPTIRIESLLLQIDTLFGGQPVQVSLSSAQVHLQSLWKIVDGTLDSRKGTMCYHVALQLGFQIFWCRSLSNLLTFLACITYLGSSSISRHCIHRSTHEF